LHAGGCVVLDDLADTDHYVCLCTDSFEGDHCEIPKGMVKIKFMLSSDSSLQRSDVAATTVSFNDYDFQSLRFLLRHQQVYDTLPSDLKLIYSHNLATYAPAIAIMNVYESNYRRKEPEYYILYFYPDQKEINITVDLTSENHCPLVQTLCHLVQTIKTPGKSE
jgi:stress-induced morphogen